MFLWTMALPLRAIEKESQAKPCALSPDVLGQRAAIPAVVSQLVAGSPGSELPRFAS